jgi:hypothetical protein
VALIALGSTSVAGAQPAPSPTEPPATAQPDLLARAEALFQEGRALMAQDRLTEACARFTESERLDPKLGTLLNAAVCHERKGMTATAWGEFTRALVEARHIGQSEREQFAAKHLSLLAPKLSLLTVACDEPALGEQVQLDGIEMDASVTGPAIPVDPGEHIAIATAKGRLTWRGSVVVDGSAGVHSIHIPKLAEEPGAADDDTAKEESATPASTVHEEPPPPTPPEATTNAAPPPLSIAPSVKTGSGPTMAWVASGVGLAAFATSAYFGIHAFSLKHDAQNECQGDACTQTGLDLFDDARHSANISSVAFLVGAAAGGLAVYFLLSRDSGSTKQVTSVQLGPRAEGAGATLITRW